MTRAGRRWLGAAAAALALVHAAALAQPAEPIVGFLSTEPRSARQTPGPLERELARRNPALAQRVKFQYRFAEGDPARLPRLAAELVALNPAVLYCSDFLAAKVAAEVTRSTPIVFLAHADPVDQRFLESLRSSNRNVTGIVTFRPVIVKMMEVALDAFPGAGRIGVLLDSSEPAAQQALPRLQALARERHVGFEAPDTAKEADLLAWMARLDASQYDVVVVTASTNTWHNRRALVGAINRLAIPAVYEAQIFLAEGGLMSYGPSGADIVPRVAEYVERVLTGADPASLPILQPTRLELVINLKSAQAQGVRLPAAVLRRADRILQ